MLSAYYTIVNNTILVFEMIIDHTRRVSEKKKTYKRYLKSHLSNWIQFLCQFSSLAEMKNGWDRSGENTPCQQQEAQFVNTLNRKHIDLYMT